MTKEKSAFSGIVTLIVVVVVIGRIAIITSRDQRGNSRLENWDNSYLIWSLFFLVAVIASYFWSKRKNQE